MVLSTFYSDGNSVRMSASFPDKSDSESDSGDEQRPDNDSERAHSSYGREGVFVA